MSDKKKGVARPATKDPPKGDTRQPDLKGMPPKTKSVLRAEEYAVALEHLADKRTQCDDRWERLLQQMKADNIKAVACKTAAGHSYKMTLKPGEETISVKKVGYSAN